MTASIRIRVTVLALSAALPAACGDLYSDPTPGTSSGIVSGGAPTAFFADAAAAPTPKDVVTACPHNPAVEAAECDAVGATCEYGSSPDMHCNTTLSCGPDGNFGMSWIARPSALCPSYACPHGPSAPIEGTPCSLPANDAGATTSDADELVCAMTDGICACSTGTDPAHGHPRVWVCSKPTATCPSTRPLAGQSCGEARTCDYGSCSFKRGMRMECKAGIWISASASCN